MGIIHVDKAKITEQLHAALAAIDSFVRDIQLNAHHVKLAKINLPYPV